MSAEDFSEYGRAGVPSLMLRIGATEPGRFAEAKAKGLRVPGVHSSLFAPDKERTIRTGVIAMTAAAPELLGRPGAR